MLRILQIFTFIILKILTSLVLRGHPRTHKSRLTRKEKQTILLFFFLKTKSRERKETIS